MLWLPSHCYTQWPDGYFVRPLPFLLSYFLFRIRRSLLYLQLSCQLSENVDGSVKLLISLLPTIRQGIHAHAGHATNECFALFIFCAYTRDALFIAVTRSRDAMVPYKPHTYSSASHTSIRERELHCSKHTLNMYRKVPLVHSSVFAPGDVS